MNEPPIVVVVGLGNPVRGDDAVGLRVAEALERLLKESPIPGTRVVTSTRGGFELMDLLAGADHGIVVDCLALPDPTPGRVRELPLDQLSGASRLVGSHDVGFETVVELGRLVGAPLPARLEILGVEARLTDVIEEGLSPAVAAVVEPLARQLHGRLSDACATILHGAHAGSPHFDL